MIAGPRILAARFPKTASTWLARELVAAGVASPRDPQPGQPTHRGLWSVEDMIPGRLVLGGIRDPWSWHVSYYRHHLDADGLPGDRLTPWAPVVDIEHVMRASPTYGVAAIIAAHAHPGHGSPFGAIDLDWRPTAWAWALPPGDVPPRRWMDERGCGLMTWAYVRTYYPRHMWGLSVAELLDRRDERYPVTFLDTADPAPALREALQGLGVDHEPGPPVNVGTRPSVGPLSQSLRDLIVERERLVCGLHGYGGG